MAEPNTHRKERELQTQITAEAERGVPGTEVLAGALLSPTRFCVYLDRPRGVGHAPCGTVTALLRGYLERYTVDVSSPGLERPLRKPAHFRNAVGRRVALRTDGDIGGRRRFRGQVVAAGERSFPLQTEGGEGGIPCDARVRGNLIDEG